MGFHITLSTAALVAAMLAAPAAAASINLGGNNGLLGGSGNGSNASVNTGNTLGGGGSNAAGDINTGVGDQNANARINLFDDTPDATATLGNGTTNTTGTLDLFGNDNDPTTLGGGSSNLLGATPVQIGTADEGTVIDLFGGSDNGSAGSTTGGGLFSGGSARSDGNVTLLASTDGTGATCANPTSAQIQAMTQRHQYDAKFANGATGINIVEVPLCKTAAHTVARIASSDDNLATLRSSVAKRPGLRSALQQQGHRLTDVIAADRANGRLTLYVY